MIRLDSEDAIAAVAAVPSEEIEEKKVAEAEEAKLKTEKPEAKNKIQPSLFEKPAEKKENKKKPKK